jgi:hypothetical protein
MERVIPEGRDSGKVFRGTKPESGVDEAGQAQGKF